ncbi:MAG: hypothetical protein IT463_02515 [Planctomycetes bacterium]|nr:hypothetical protein [Planctomycetota bacterium]
MRTSIWKWAALCLPVAALLVAFAAGGVRADDRADEAVRIARGKLADKNPDVRAKAVEDCARANNKNGAEAVMQGLSAENDGPAGYRMAEAVMQLNSPEAHEAIEKILTGWTKPNQLFPAYWCCIGLARQKTAGADAILKKVVNEAKEKDVHIKAAALEALAFAERSDLSELLLVTLKQYTAEWDTKSVILSMTCIVGAPKLAKGAPNETRIEIVLALADVLEKTTNDRTQYFAAKALSEITGEDTYITPEFWRFWVKMGGKKVEGREEGATTAGRDVPKFFKAAAVGKNVMFVIDISGSMQHPVNLPPEMKKKPPPPPKEEKKGPVTGNGKAGGNGDAGKEEEEKKPEIPPPDYSKVVSKLDLAKVELIHTLRYLPEDYKFNIVVYHTTHDLLDNSVKNLVPANEANKQKFIKKVQDLNWAALTNIHGGMIRGFCVNEKGMIDQKKEDPAWHPECLNSGATTIFFLTDGSPTISDDTTNPGEVGRPGPGGVILPVGNGRMCIPQNIIEDIRRVNTFRKVVINTVGIGPHDRTLMQALAEMTGGEYIDRSGVADRG